MDYYQPRTYKPRHGAYHPDTEMKTFDPVVTEPGFKEPPPTRPFDDKDDAKESRNRAKETRISVALIVLTFLASVCVLFGTLFPELSRGEVDMVPWRNILASTARQQTFLIRDRITLVNLGLWRYCYDDQLYDLVEIINPQISYNNRGRRDADETEEVDHSIVKRQQVREGDISERCHPIPEPWKMPYHVKQKTDVVKVCLIVGVVSCILAFLTSILVLITRFPILKIFQLLFCFVGAVSTSVAIGMCATMREDAEIYFNEASARFINVFMMENFGIDFVTMSINLKSANLIELEIGVCVIFVCACAGVMIITTFLAELTRNL